MRPSMNIFGVALIGLSVGYATLLITEEVRRPDSTVNSSLQHVFKSAGWEDESFTQVKTWIGKATRTEEPALSKTLVEPVVLPAGVDIYFAAAAGGGAPGYNEICAGEKRSLFSAIALRDGLFTRAD